MPTVGKVQIGQSTTISYSVDNTTWVVIDHTFNYTAPSVVYGNCDVSEFASTFVNKRATVPDLGSSTFQVYFDYEDTTHAAIMTLARTFPAPLSYLKVLYPEGTSVSYSGYFESFNEDDFDYVTPMTCTASFVLKSLPAYTAGSGG